VTAAGSIGTTAMDCTHPEFSSDLRNEIAQFRLHFGRAGSIAVNRNAEGSNGKQEG
jgi:hypothetical protein